MMISPVQTITRHCLAMLMLLSSLWLTTHARSSEYGVRWKLIVDEAADYDLPCERIGDAAGLTSSSFDRIFPWSQIRLCRIIQLPGGAHRVCYSGDPEFSSAATLGNVMVEIPRHYIKRSVINGYESRMISAGRLPGFEVDPAFVENGREIDQIYVGAYEAHIAADGRMESVSGVHPTADKTRVEYRNHARANGPGFGQFDLRTLLLIQNLFLVEHADRNSQRALGNGWGKLLQPHQTHRCARPEQGANRIITRPAKATTVAAIETGVFVGGAIQISSYEQSGKVLLAGRTLTAIKLDDPEPGFVSLHFDGPPVDTTTDMCLGGAAQKTGWADAIPGHSGHGEFHGSPPYESYRCAVKYRHMENLWGNLWCYIDGVNLANGQAFVCDDMTAYESGVTTGAYRPVALNPLLQDDNGDIGGVREIHFLKNLGYDPQQPWLALPVDYTHQGLSESPGKSMPLRNGHFGDYYYLNTKATCYVHGGGFDHYWRCGLFTLRGWATDKQKWYLYGSRLIFKPLATIKPGN
jgi:hypothetical protein